MEFGDGKIKKKLRKIYSPTRFTRQKIQKVVSTFQKSDSTRLLIY